MCLEPERAAAKTTDEAEDLDLVRQLRGGNHDALTALFDKYHVMVFWIARRMLENDGEAEEVVQQVFLDTFRAIDQFDEQKAAYKTWLFQFAYHRAINRRKHLEAKRFYCVQELDEEALPADLYQGVGRALQLSTVEVVRLVEQILKSLKPCQRAAIQLTFFEGLTAEEIAAKTGETPHAVRHNLYRGLATLRTMLFGRGTEQSGRKEQTKPEGGLFAPARPF